ncbi:MAG: hypothetical protein WB987_05980 [Candidatus Acidiferrales bacterium]
MQLALLTAAHGPRSWPPECATAPYLTEKVRRATSQSGSVQDLAEIPESIRRIFVTAHDIAPVWHVRTQVAFQRHVENAVSKTVNLRHTATRNDIERAFLLAHELGCKGITVVRDGCKHEQILRPGEIEKKHPFGMQPCPECGGTMMEASGCVSGPSCGYAFRSM